MRYDDDNSQSFGPVLRRIAILAVIITAVPVMLWSITAFMRTFVAQPVIPSPRPLAAADTANAAPAAASSVSTPTNAPVVEARATATDARGADANQLSDSATPAPTTTASLAPAPAAPTRNAPAAPQTADQAAANSANSPWPDPAQAIGGQQSQSAASNDGSSDTPAASAPLTGPIPLPPHRPKVLAMADGAIPLPRRRPADAEATADPPPDSGNFLTHLFGQTH
jgi:hypothetical protein